MIVFALKILTFFGPDFDEIRSILGQNYRKIRVKSGQIRAKIHIFWAKIMFLDMPGEFIPKILADLKNVFRVQPRAYFLPHCENMLQILKISHF